METREGKTVKTINSNIKTMSKLINETYDDATKLVISQLEKYKIEGYTVETLKPNLIRAFRAELGWLLNTKITDDWYVSAIFDVVHLLYFERADKFLGKYVHNYSREDGTAPFYGYQKIPLVRACQQVSKKYVTQWKRFKEIITDDGIEEHPIERYDTEYVDYLKTVIKDYQNSLSELKKDKASPHILKRIKRKKEEVEQQLREYEESVTKVNKLTIDEHEDFTHTEEAEFQDLLSKVNSTLTDDEKKLLEALLDGYTQTEWGKNIGYGKKKVIKIKKSLIEKIKKVDPEISEVIEDIQS